MSESNSANDSTVRATWAREVRTRLSSLRLSPTRENEIVDELSQHLDDHYREMIAGGTLPKEAERLALADFRSGNVLASLHSRKAAGRPATHQGVIALVMPSP